MVDPAGPAIRRELPVRLAGFIAPRPESEAVPKFCLIKIRARTFEVSFSLELFEALREMRHLDTVKRFALRQSVP